MPDPHSGKHFENFELEEVDFQEKEKPNEKDYDNISKNGDENGKHLQLRFRDVTGDNGRPGIRSNGVSRFF